MADDLMNKICDLSEVELKKQGIFYIRNGSVFTVKEKNIPDLFEIQSSVTFSLVEKGEITIEKAIAFIEKGKFN